MNTLFARILFVAVTCLPISALCVDTAGPKAEKAPAVRDGSSYEKAIAVKSVAAEYEWLKKKYPGYKLDLQSLQMKEGKPFDVLKITLKNGKGLEVFFDISSFFGK